LLIPTPTVGLFSIRFNLSTGQATAPPFVSARSCEVPPSPTSRRKTISFFYPRRLCKGRNRHSRSSIVCRAPFFPIPPLFCNLATSSAPLSPPFLWSHFFFSPYFFPPKVYLRVFVPKRLRQLVSLSVSRPLPPSLFLFLNPQSLNFPFSIFFFFFVTIN